MKKLLSFFVIILAVLFVSATRTNAQGRYIDPHYPLWDVVDSNRDLIRSGHNRMEIDSYIYGGRVYGLGALLELAIRGRHARNRDYSRDNDCGRTSGCEESYSDRSYQQTRDRRYRQERTVVLEKYTITNFGDCGVEVLLDGGVLEMPNGGTLLQPNHRISIAMPRGETFSVTAYQGRNRVRVDRDEDGNFIIQ